MWISSRGDDGCASGNNMTRQDGRGRTSSLGGGTRKGQDAGERAGGQFAERISRTQHLDRPEMK